MKSWWRNSVIGMLVASTMIAFGTNPGMAESRAHVYLLRGLMNIFSLGMDSLAAELNRRGVYTTVDNHADWQALANQAAADYKAGKEGPIIVIGHSLGADAAMEMGNYLGARGVPVALVVPFDGTQSLSAGPGVARVLNLTQRDYAYMRRGPGFKGTLVNVDVSSDPSIDHLNIDKSPRLHARVISEVLSVVGSHRMPAPGVTTPTPTPVSAPAPAGAPGAPAAAPAGGGAAKPEAAPATPAAPAATPAAPAKSGNGAMSAPKTLAEGGTPIIAAPEKSSARPLQPAD
jgi:Thioesterase domain